MSEELAQGGRIQPGMVVFGHAEPETLFIPPDAQIYPRGTITLHFANEEQLRRFIRREVHAALDELAEELKQQAFQPNTTALTEEN
jgi:hypothetical protein